VSISEVLSPVLLKLVDRLSAAIIDQDFSTFSYADHIVIAVQDKLAHTFRELMQEALNVVVKWSTKYGLSISRSPIYQHKEYRGLGPLTLDCKQPKILGGVKY
jgi:hypothetical protein